MGAADHAAGKARAFCISVLVEMNKDGMCKPIDSGIQTANTIAQPLWQHWNDAVGQINAVAAPARFAIQRALGLYVSGDIGNVHTEAPTILYLLNLNRVVEIARVIRIDGDDKFFAQIFTSFELSRIDSFGNPLRLIQNILRKFCAEVVFADDRKHVDARRGCRSEYFDDFAFRIDVARFPRVQADHDFVADARRCSHALIAIWAHVDVVHKPRIIRDDVVKVSRPLQRAYDRIVSALQDSNHTPFAPSFDPPVRRIARYTHNHAVAVHPCPDIFRRDENVWLA